MAAIMIDFAVTITPNIHDSVNNNDNNGGDDNCYSSNDIIHNKKFGDVILESLNLLRTSFHL
jgi:hypothetical protein